MKKRKERTKEKERRGEKRVTKEEGEGGEWEKGRARKSERGRYREWERRERTEGERSESDTVEHAPTLIRKWLVICWPGRQAKQRCHDGSSWKKKGSLIGPVRSIPRTTRTRKSFSLALSLSFSLFFLSLRSPPHKLSNPARVPGAHYLLVGREREPAESAVNMINFRFSFRKTSCTVGDNQPADVHTHTGVQPPLLSLSASIFPYPLGWKYVQRNWMLVTRRFRAEFSAVAAVKRVIALCVFHFARHDG